MTKGQLTAALITLACIVINLSGCLNPFGSSQSVIYGTVLDNNGNPVPEARIKATVLIRDELSEDWRDAGETVTDTNGRYRLYTTAGFKPLKLTASKAGLTDNTVQLPSMTRSSCIIDLTLNGAVTLSSPKIDPPSAVNSQNVPIDIYVLANGTKTPDKLKIRAQCYDSRGNIVESFSMIPMPAETSLPAYYHNEEAAFDSSLFKEGTYTFVFTGCDDDGNKTNQIKTTLVILEG